MERRHPCMWHSPSSNSSVQRCCPKLCTCVSMDSELQGREWKCREVSKHQTSKNATHFRHDPVNFWSDHAKQACDHRTTAGTDRIVSSDTSFNYSRQFENEEAVFTMGSPQPDSATEAGPDWQLLALNDADPTELLLVWWLVMSCGSAMAYLRRNNSPLNGDIKTVLQKRSDQHCIWKTIGISLLGHTRNPTYLLAFSGCDSEQQHLLWHCDPSALQNSAAEEGQVGQRKCSCCTQCLPTLVQTDKGLTGWTWLHSPPTSFLLSRFSPLRLRSLR
jgi:hypothetical protein